MSALNWGILGAAHIAESRMVPAMVAAKNNGLAAVGSRDRARAAALAVQAPGAAAYGSYEEVLADPRVNAVYIPLPNGLHAEWAIKAAEAGKHVLVEKTFASNADEAERVIEACEKASVVVSEAFMYRFHPLTRRVLDVVRSGMLGTLKSINSTFAFTLEKAEDIRRNQALAGGALFDVGTYCVHLVRALAGEEPVEVMARGAFGAAGTDETLSGLIRFGNGVTATITASFDMPRVSPLMVIGTRGILYAPQMFTYFADNVLRIGLDDPRKPMTTSETVEHVLHANPYTLMLEDFAEAVALKRKPRIGSDEILKHQRVLDALMSSARGDCV